MQPHIKILYAYIIKKYLGSFGFVVLIFTLIACVIDLSEKIENFIREPITRKEIFVDYYLNFIPHINALLLPLYALIAVIFFTSRMAYNSEIISILNAGVSFRRLLIPYMMAAGIIGVIQLVLNHLIVPAGNKKRLAIEHKYIWKTNDRGKTENVHMFLNADTKIYIGNYRKQDSTMHAIRLELYKNDTLVSVLKADDAAFQKNTNTWKLHAVQRRSFSGLNEYFTKQTELDTTINVYPDDFVRYLEQNEMLTTPELQEEIAKANRRGLGNPKSYVMELHRRSAEPVSIIILTLIGMPLAARKVRGGFGLHMALGIGIGAIFAFFSKLSVAIAAQPNVPAFLGIWIPNIIFGAVAVYLLYKAQR